MIETGKGLLGRPDPVAWQAMQDVMSLKTFHSRLTRNLKQARDDGNVVMSIGLCRAQMACEQEANEAIAVCGRIAGSEAVKASLEIGVKK